MKRPTLIIDSSVAVKWLSHEDENFVAQAKKILEDFQNEKVEIAAPELTKCEIGNALTHKEFTLPQINTFLEKYFAVPIKFYKTDLELAQLATEIALQNKITFHDAIFIALAQSLKATLVTANPKHQKPGLKSLAKIISLENY